MEMRSDGKSEADEVALMERLSDHPTEYLSNLDSRLQILDDFFQRLATVLI